MSTPIETYHEDGQWKNRHEGSDRAMSTHPTKNEAIQAGKDAAQKAGVEDVIKKLDGTIGEKNSYGNDPRNVPG